MQDLGTLPGGDFSQAFANSNAGQVVGASADATGRSRAFLWTDGAGMQDIGPGRANDINDAGRVVGTSGLFFGPSGATVRYRAFLWSAGIGMQSLGVLPGDLFSTAAAINSAGQVVGESAARTNERRPYLWTADDGMQDRNALIDPLDPLKSVTTLLSARDINNAGQIVGSAMINGSGHAYLATPVPEPAVWGLLLVGLPLTGLMLRRRALAKA